MASLPSQIGRYQIKSLIGRGGMGDLYLAHDPNTNRLVALKLLNGQKQRIIQANRIVFQNFLDVQSFEVNRLFRRVRISRFRSFYG